MRDSISERPMAFQLRKTKSFIQTFYQAILLDLCTVVTVKIVTIVCISHSYSNSRTKGANGRLVELESSGQCTVSNRGQ